MYKITQEDVEHGKLWMQLIITNHKKPIELQENKETLQDTMKSKNPYVTKQFLNCMSAMLVVKGYAKYKKGDLSGIVPMYTQNELDNGTINIELIVQTFKQYHETFKTNSISCNTSTRYDYKLGGMDIKFEPSIDIIKSLKHIEFKNIFPEQTHTTMVRAKAHEKTTKYVVPVAQKQINWIRAGMIAIALSFVVIIGYLVINTII